MKFISRIATFAMAAVLGLSITAQATPTNDVNNSSVNGTFEDDHCAIGSMTNAFIASGWSDLTVCPWNYSLEDNSSFIESTSFDKAAEVASFRAATGLAGEGIPTAEEVQSILGNRMLKLDTQGNELSYKAMTTNNATVFIDALVKMVGSDTAPDVSTPQGGTPVQTAVYLKTFDEVVENGVTNTPAPQLMAYVTDPTPGHNTNAWLALAADGIEIANGDWIHLKVIVDYTPLTDQTGSCNAELRFFVNGTQAYLDGFSSETYINIANYTSVATTKRINEVAFKGTGVVDNFSVRQMENDAIRMTVIREIVGTGDESVVLKTETTPAVPVTGTAYNFGDDTFFVYGSKLPQFAVAGHTNAPAPEAFHLYKITSEDEGGVVTVSTNEVTTVPITVTYDTVWEVVVVSFVTDPEVFSDGDTWLLRAYYEPNQYNVTIRFESEDPDNTYEPDDIVSIATYGSSFTTNLEALVQTGYDVADCYWVASPNYFGAGADGVEVSLSNITNDVVVTMYGSWKDSGSGPVYPAGALVSTVDGHTVAIYTNDTVGLAFSALANGASLDVDFSAKILNPDDLESITGFYMVVKTDLTSATAYRVAAEVSSMVLDPDASTEDTAKMSATLPDGYAKLFVVGIADDTAELDDLPELP